MTASEMHANVLVTYEKITSNQAPGITDRDMSIILSNAQLHVVKTTISSILNTKKEGFEESEIRMQGLSALIASANINTFTTDAMNLPNGVYAELPAEFMYTILEMCRIDQNNCATGQPDLVPVFVMNHNDYYNQILNPFKKPYYNGKEGLVWRLTVNRTITGYDSQVPISVDPQTGYSTVPRSPKRHELITAPNFSVVDYYIRYIRFPREIVTVLNSDGTTNLQINCELDESIHKAIVDVAVDMLKEAMSQPNQQILPSMQQIE